MKRIDRVESIEISLITAAIIFLIFGSTQLIFELLSRLEIELQLIRGTENMIAGVILLMIFFYFVFKIEPKIKN